MNKCKLLAFLNTKLLNKAEVMASIDSYIDHCCSTDEEGWSKDRKETVVNLLYNFLDDVKKTNFPNIKELGWFYSYEFSTDSIILELERCEGIEIDSDGEIKESTSGQIFRLVETKCSYLSVEDYAKKYDVKTTTVRQWIRRGKLRTAVKLGGEWIIPEIADKPKRGYAPVTYSWSNALRDLEEAYPYLQECQSIYIYQDEYDKTRYNALLYGKNHFKQKIVLNASGREKLELALISHDKVKVDEVDNHIMFVPDKESSVLLKGDKIMDKKQIENYKDYMKVLEDEGLKISIDNEYYDEDGMYLWRFNVEMKKFVDIDESEKNEEKEKQDIDDDGYRTILAVNEGIIIPAEIDFYDDEGMGIISSYSSAEDLCDCISEDLLTAYKAVTDKEELGISKEICEELKIDEFDSSSSPIMYIQDISFVDKKYLNLFLKMLGTISEGLPCRGYCKLVVILLKWSEEADTAKVFLDCGWKLKPADGGTVVAYGKI